MRKISLALLAAAVAVLGDAGIAAAAEPPTADEVGTRINEATAAFRGEQAAVVSASAQANAPTTTQPPVTQQGAPSEEPAAAVAAQEPTSMGQAIVGFVRGRMPAVAPGSRFNGLDVARVSQKGSFFTVNVADLDVVHRALANVPGVAYVEDNGVLRATVTPNDPRYGEQYGPNMMGFPAAWGSSAGYGSSAITVGIVDSGILKTHQDLTGGRVLQGFDYYNNDSDPNDNCGHGTHVAGTVGASTNNGLGVAGMSQARLLMMKALQSSFLGGCSGPYDAIAEAIMDAADQGARIISMSIGGSASATLQNAVNYADNKGVILVAAAGNDGGANSIDYPAAYPNVIAVAALTSSKARASYSDGGPQLDIAAPGSNVLSTYTGSNNATYSSLSGTSMATPHVAGALALAMSCAPAGTTKATLVNALYSTAEDLGTAGYDQSYGHGLARADRLVSQICGGGSPPPPPPSNSPPTANFTTSTSGLTVSVNGSSSSDPNGDALTYSWNWGDNTAAGSGVTASHTYAAAGTYNVTLTVNDGKGGTNSKTLGVTVSSSSPPPPSDPDPSTPTITSGQTVSVSVSSSTTERFYKIFVPTGRSQIRAATTGPSCSWWSCSVDADLYTRQSSRPTDSTYACRSQARGNAETCTSSTASGVWWYVRVKRYSGSGSVNLTVTLS